MLTLESVVKLYRISGKPEFNGSSFSSEIKFKENRELIELLFDPRSNLGSFKDTEVDDNDIFTLEDLPQHVENFKFTFNVTQGSAEKFYKSKSDFITINTLKKGEIPDRFYIVEDDFFSQDAYKPSYIIKIEQICNLITTLSKLAHFHDIKKDSKGSFFKLVFILHSESKSSSAVIETNLSEDSLYGDDLDTNVINSLSSDHSKKDIHYIEKINTFRNTLIEYINGNNSNFTEIILNWNKINELYINNLAAYMSAFSFHKSRKEVSDAETEYAEKLSKVVSEITTKALAIPLSLAASIAIYNVKSDSEALIALLGILIASVITSLLSSSQLKQLGRITHAKETLFSGIENRLGDEQSELKIRLIDAKKQLNKNEKFSHRVLITILFISWVPTFVGTLAVIKKLYCL